MALNRVKWILNSSKKLRNLRYIWLSLKRKMNYWKNRIIHLSKELIALKLKLYTYNDYILIMKKLILSLSFLMISFTLMELKTTKQWEIFDKMHFMNYQEETKLVKTKRCRGKLLIKLIFISFTFLMCSRNAYKTNPRFIGLD